MRLSRIYSDRPDIFGPVVFNSGLSLVVAEIRLPENQEKVTHNLGKSTLGQMIDFCLLKTKDSKFFLYKYEQKFSDFTFYLEVETNDGRFITIARSPASGSKIALLKSEVKVDDASRLDPKNWDHTGLPFERAKRLLDAWLGLSALKPWDYRNMIGFLIRGQNDYGDVFKLRKFAGKHRDWKPFVAHIMGLDSQNIDELYEVRGKLEETTNDLRTLSREWGTAETDTTELDALIALREKDLSRRQEARDAINFTRSDAEVSEELTNNLEEQITVLNEERYSLQRDIERIHKSLDEETILFRPNDAERIFQEAGVIFGDQIKRTYEELIAFNREISSERSSALRNELAASESRVKVINARLKELNESRAEALAYLRESETMSKFKALSHEISQLEGQLGVLEERRKSASRLATLRRQQRQHEQITNALQTSVEENIEAASASKDSTFSTIRTYFNEIIHFVLHEEAILTARFNSSGGLDFYAEFVDAKGTATSADRGTTYRKLMCIAFDLAVVRAHLNVSFPRFVYHDGAFEALERRAKENLLEVFKTYASYGVQPIVTGLAGDIPDSQLVGTETVCLLHDEGPQGRLFRFESW